MRKTTPVRGAMHFPADFKWGTATSAYQVEGNNRNSDWWAWEARGKIQNDDRSGPACDWWTNAEADLDRAVEMGNNAHRLSLEWSRIEPEPSVFDQEALDRYREILQGMRDRGLAPMVTLHHFSNPLWLVEKGDFTSELIVDYFQRYAAKAVDALGDLVTHWVTINEPMVYVFMRYLARVFPEPRSAGWGAARRATAGLLSAHAAGYHTIKARRPDASVGIVKNVPIFQPHPDANRLSGWWRDRLDYVFNKMWWRSMVTGRLQQPVGRHRIPHLANAFDFIGINYYSRYLVRFPRLLTREWEPGAALSDDHFSELYPEGIFAAISSVVALNKPIYITENGLPDAKDKLRARFLVTHLREIWRAISFCYPVMGYYHWSLVDNFEWDRGWSPRFGLLGLDVATQERTWRRSARLYAEICRTGSVSSDMVDRYAPECAEDIFPGYAVERQT